MSKYKIFHCPRCHTLVYCPYHQKTKTCPTCQKVIKLNNTQILKTADSFQKALFLVQKSKLPLDLRDKIPDQSKNVKHPESKRDLFLELIYKIQKDALNEGIEQATFLKATEMAGFSENWVLNQLNKLEIQGLLIHTSKKRIKFIL